MPSYRSIKQTLFHDPEFQALPQKAGYMLVLLRLMATNITALYRPDWETIGKLVRAGRGERKALLDVLAKPKANGSPWVLHEHGWAWVVNGFRYELGEQNGRPNEPNKNHLAAVRRALAETPTHVSLPAKFAAMYGNGAISKGLDTILEGFGKGSDTLLDNPVPVPGSGTGSGTLGGSGQEPDPPKGKRKADSRPKGYQKQVWDLFRAYFEKAYETPWYMAGGKDARGAKVLWDRVAGDLAALRAKLEVALRLWQVRPEFYPFPTDTMVLAAKWNVYCKARLDAIQQGGQNGAAKPARRLCPFGSAEYGGCQGSADEQCRGCPKHEGTRAAELPGSGRRAGESSQKVVVTSEPVLDEHGKPVLDRAGRPVMRTVRTSQPLVSVAEMLRGKGQT